MIGATRYRATAEINRQTDLAKQIADLQAQVSSEKRLSKPSDDPAASTRVAEIRQTQADQAVWTNNISLGASIASAADIKLGSINDALDRAKELVLSGRNETTSPADRASIAQQLRDIANDLGSFAQSSDPTGAPLFPTGTPLSIPVSDVLSVPATVSRTELFDNVTTAGGTKSLQAILNDAAAAVESTASTRGTDVQNSLDAIDAGSAHVTAVRVDQGVRANRFDDAKDQLDTSSEDLSEERAGLENTDLTYALSEIQSKQVALQAAQTVFAQANRSSLFDLLG
jgi:flagellar hook-associated protein 3 FlgL